MCRFQAAIQIYLKNLISTTLRLLPREEALKIDRKKKLKQERLTQLLTSWKVSKYGPEINLYLETFHAVTENIRTYDSYLSRNVLGKIYGKGAILPIVKVAEQSPGFVLRRCFKKFSQNSQKNTCDKVAFLLACSLYKKGIYCRCSSMNFAKSSGHLFCREPVRG